MTKPTPEEIDRYLEKLSAQAGFMADPALTEALEFIRRLIPPKGPDAAELAAQKSDEKAA